MNTNTVISRKHIMLTILFAVYMSEYMLCLICMDQSAYALSDTGYDLHYLRMPAVAAGFLLFPLSRRLGTDIRTRRIIILISNIMFMAGMTVMMGIFFAVNVPGYMASCMISLLSLGFLGGAVYYYFAMGFVMHPYLGRLSGIGGVAAFLIQMSVQYLIPANPAMLVLLVAGFAFTAYITLLSKERYEWMFDEPLEFAGEGDPSLPGVRRIAAGVAAMLLLYMICGFTDTILVSMNFAGDMGIYAWPRLFGAVGYLVGGFLADIARRKWLALSAVCMVILCIPLPFILSEGYVVAGTCLYYIIVISQLEFLNVFFWELAPRTSHPALWSGMSRVLGCVSVIILPLFTGVPVIVDMMTEVILIAGAIVLFSLGGFIPSKSAAQEGSRSETLLSASDITAVYAQRYSLTPREKDVLQLLAETDDDIQIIADKLNISRRTVYRHINNIYEKTGTDTRYALIRSYYSSDNDSGAEAKFLTRKV